MEQPNQPLTEPIEQKHWVFRPLNRMDMIILAVICLVAVGVAAYDFYSLKATEQRCLTNCNNHWVKEFETKCVGIWGEKENVPKLTFDYNLTSI